MDINNTWRKLRLQYEGHQLFECVRKSVQGCSTCQARAKRKHKRQAPLSLIPTPDVPFYMVGCDAVGPMLPSTSGNRYLLVAVDYLTRWPCVQAVRDITAETTAMFLFDQVVASHGVPSFILTDQGSNFTSSYVSSFLRRLECRHLTTTAYRPQTNGLVERMNQTVVQALSKIVRDKDDKHNWDKYLTAALLAIRNTRNDTTNFSPAMLLYGVEMRTPSTWPLQDPTTWKENWKTN